MRAGVLALPLLWLPFLASAGADLSSPPAIAIPRLTRAPELEDFLLMEPNGEVEGQLARVEGFIQRDPNDGQPSSQRTVVYFGYDDRNLYLIFVCFDTDPGEIRARMMPRERIFGDDRIELMLDTFHDQRRAYSFQVNPRGIQFDALWTEGQRYDGSFDTIWHSRGQLTDQGYVVWMAIPFKSLRFSPESDRPWGVILRRNIPRTSEDTFWPRVSNRIEGRLNQAATLTGLENISPSHNIQLIPYGVFRSFRALDTRDDDNPHFVEREEGDAGLDAKFVFKDSLVLDVAVNPDFSQVESDRPQRTVNQRFEVFFPEKRPFFLENANFFETPINLVFTRRILDPQLGARLTGKLGPYALGAFVIDDEAPGKLVASDDPLQDKRALFGIFRLSRDIFQQSSLGVIYTDREFEESYNRVGGLDGRLKLSQNWVADFQAVASSTRFLEGEEEDGQTHRTGTAYTFELNRSGRSFDYFFEYNDFSPGFRTEAGFLRRSDIRRFAQFVGYRVWTEGDVLLNWGPRLFMSRVYDHEWTRLDWRMTPAFEIEFLRRTSFSVFYNAIRERLRPQDFDGLTMNRDFSQPGYGFEFRSNYFSTISVSGFMGWGKGINFEPPEGEEPFLADEHQGRLEVTLRPTTPLRIDNTYIFFRLKDRSRGAGILNNHILRSRWNYQFTRELSLRAILQYDAALTNEPAFTSRQTSKNLNADFLLTYLLNPWTALFIGYNGNAQNIDLVPTSTGSEIVRPRNRFINDAKQFFVKFSYLIRF